MSPEHKRIIRDWLIGAVEQAHRQVTAAVVTVGHSTEPGDKEYMMYARYRASLMTELLACLSVSKVTSKRRPRTAYHRRNTNGDAT